MTDYLHIYNEVFSNKDYNDHLWTEPRFLFVIRALKRNPMNSLIDIGAGHGVLLAMAHRQNIRTALTAVDLNNYHHLKYVAHINADITKAEDRGRVAGRYDMLTCLDCLEHVEEDYISDIFRMFLILSDSFIFSIANHSDIINGVELHKIQKPYTYWTEKLSEFFDITFFEALYDGRLYLYKCRSKT